MDLARGGRDVRDPLPRSARLTGAMGDLGRTIRIVSGGAIAAAAIAWTDAGRAVATGLPRPVATTVTRIWLAISGSITVPTTTVASSEANCLMTLPTSWNSPMDKSMPAVTLTKEKVAGSLVQEAAGSYQ